MINVRFLNVYCKFVWIALFIQKFMWIQKNNVYFKKTYGVLITLNILSRGVCLPFSSNDSKGLVESGQNGFCSLWKKT